MSRSAAQIVVLVSTATVVLAQPASERSHFELGKAAMDAHDPAAAITHFEQDDTKAARAWLAVALMMESRSPSDQYVERAFEAAARSRAENPTRLRSRADLAAALRPSEIVIATLVGERHSYAWAFDRAVLIGYPLPQPQEIMAAVERVNAYAATQDRDGVRRIADEFVPALLGPVFDRLPSLTRVILVMDGPLRRLPISGLLGDGRATVSVVDDDVLFDEIGRTPPPDVQRPIWLTAALIGIAAVGGITLFAFSRLAKRRSRARS